MLYLKEKGPLLHLDSDVVPVKADRSFRKNIGAQIDDAHLQISELTNMKNSEYYSLNQESDKPFYFINRNSRNYC